MRRREYLLDVGWYFRPCRGICKDQERASEDYRLGFAYCCTIRRTYSSSLLSCFAQLVPKACSKSAARRSEVWREYINSKYRRTSRGRSSISIEKRAQLSAYMR